MNAFDCYSRAQLHNYLLGQLPEEKIDLISRHLDQCEICEDTIVGLDTSDDTLVGMLLEQSDDPGAGDEYDLSKDAVADPYFSAAIKRIKNLDFETANENEPGPEPRVIHRIGEYEIGERLATGGMGSVYRGRHLRLEKQVAVKVLPDRKMQNADAIARFSREMKIIGQMDHPSMVQATDAGEIDGTHFLVMELVEGLDLSRIVRLCGRLDPANAAEVIRCAAIGLHDAHQRDVIHRDVKPSNLMLNRDGATKILDLGLATLGGLHGHVDELTTVGQLMGTLDYMAPEQYGNDHSIDRRTDVYGLGATLYKLLTGTAPYSNPEAKTPLKKMKAMATEHPKPILDRRPDLAPELAGVVDRCLERDPTNRFQSALDLSHALDRFSAGHSLKSLLYSAEKRNVHHAEPIEQDSPIPVNPVVRNIELKPKEPAVPLRSPQQGTSWAGRIIKTTVAIMLAGFLVWGGITIYLNTTAGQLIIESEIDGINISVVQDEKPTREIQIEHGTSATRLRAGKYRIEILGETDGLVIDNNKFELKRGGRIVAKITRKRPTDPRITPNPAQVANSLSRTKQPSLIESGNDEDAQRETPNLLMDLFDLEHEVKAANLRILFIKQQINSQRRSDGDPVRIELQAKLKLAELELETAIQKLKAAKNQNTQRRIDERQALRHRIEISEQDLKAMESALSRSSALFRKGYISRDAVEADELKLVQLREKIELDKSKLAQIPMGSSMEGKLPEPDKVAPIQSNGSNPDPPTFKGKTLEAYVHQLSKFKPTTSGNSTSVSRARIITAIEQLIARTRAELVERIFSKNIANYENELSIPTQGGVIFSLGQLCKKESDRGPESMTVRLLGYWAKVASRIEEPVHSPTDRSYNLPEPSTDSRILIGSLRPLWDVSPDVVQDFLISQYRNAGPSEKLVVIHWLMRVPDKLVENTTPNWNTIAAARWLPLLMIDSESELESLSTSAAYSLQLFHDQAKVQKQFEKLLDSPHPPVRHNAVKVLSLVNPDLPGLARQAKRAVAEGLPPQVYVDLVNSEGGLPLLKEYLADPDSGVNAFNERANLVLQIGRRAGEDKFDDSAKKEMTSLVLAELRRESTDRIVLARAWETFHALTGKPNPRLFKGRDLLFWQNQISERSTSTKNRAFCLAGINELEGPNLSLKSLLAIADGVEHEKSKSQSEDSATLFFSEQHVADFLSDSAERFSKFLNLFDQLGDQHESLILSTLRSSLDTQWSRFMRHTPFVDSVTNFLDKTLDSRDESIRWKTYAVICNILNTNPERNMENWAHAALDSLVADENESLDLKLAVLSQLSEQRTQAAIRRFRKSMIERLDLQSTGPSHLATILEMEKNRVSGSDSVLFGFALEVLVKHHSILDDEIELIPFDISNGPTIPDPEVNTPRVKLIDQITKIIERERILDPDQNSHDKEVAKSELPVLADAIEILAHRLEQSDFKIEEVKLKRSIRKLTERRAKAERSLELP